MEEFAIFVKFVNFGCHNNYFRPGPRLLYATINDVYFPCMCLAGGDSGEALCASTGRLKSIARHCMVFQKRYLQCQVDAFYQTQQAALALMADMGLRWNLPW